MALLSYTALSRRDAITVLASGFAVDAPRFSNSISPARSRAVAVSKKRAKPPRAGLELNPGFTSVAIHDLQRQSGLSRGARAGV
jgi:hypothetical protein